ncbi:MAG TPA: sugar phosphate isomerase/epimerase [Bryobacteraceae bacterium]|nr:sugar phosphate isomerase/epimerase [Bryobacteraceae bacterium]
MLTRREWLAGAAVARLRAETESRYRVGITTNTRGGWEKDVFLSFREAHEAGYPYVESFIDYLGDYLDKPDELLKKTGAIGVKFDTISNGGRMETHFEDPARHEKIIEQHIRLVEFIKRLGCDHLKINTGPRRPGCTTDQDLKNMAMVFNLLGKRISAEGLKFGVHAHMWTQFENRREIETVLGATDPQHVWFVLDTGHITMAGIDPVELTRTLGHRIIEFHLKDTKPEYRGGAKQRRERNDAMKDPIFFELGKGGVDFPAIKAHLDQIGWRGWLTVELDSSPYRPPKESAAISRRYIENVLGIPV